MLSHLNKLHLCGIFELNNGVGQGIIQFFFKSPHQSNSFRRESISKFPGGKPMNVFTFGLWSSYQTWQLWNAVTPKQVRLVRTCFNWMTTWPRPFFSLKSPHNSNSFRHESISKLPDLTWWPQTKDKKHSTFKNSFRCESCSKFGKFTNILNNKKTGEVVVIFRNLDNCFSFHNSYYFSTDLACSTLSPTFVSMTRS